MYAPAPNVNDPASDMVESFILNWAEFTTDEVIQRPTTWITEVVNTTESIQFLVGDHPNGWDKEFIKRLAI